MLTAFKARECAKAFVEEVSGRQWTLDTAESFLPDGYELRNAEDSDLYPITVSHVAQVFRRAVRR